MSMKKFIFLIFLIQLSLQEDDILFIGNSMTYYNNLAKVVKGFADKLGHKINVKAATNGGKDLIYQSTAQNIIDAANKGGYEYAVLQDIVGKFNGDNIIQGAEGCINLVHNKSPNAKIIFYEPPPTATDIAAKRNKLPYFTYYYIEAARKFGAKLAPAGEAFFEILTKYNLDYHISDGKHPQPLGTFLFASTIYFTIFENEEANDFTNSDQKFLDTLINDNVAHTEEGKLQTYDLDTLNLLFRTGKKYADAVREAVADTSGKTKYISIAGEYEP